MLPVPSITIWLEVESADAPPAALTAPRLLMWRASSGQVDFSWLPPVSWGPGPHPTAPYQISFRTDLATAQLGPWPAPIADTDTTAPVSYQHTVAQEQVQFRVRSQDSDGNVSDWVTSRILIEGQEHTGRFGGRFGGRFS